MTEAIDQTANSAENNEELSQEDVNLQVGIFTESPIATLLRTASSKERHQLNLELPDGTVMPLWVRKPSATTVSRYYSARKGGKERDSSEIAIQLVMDQVDKKVADEGRESDFVAAFPPSTKQQLKEVANTVISDLVDKILSLDNFSVEEGKGN